MKRLLSCTITDAGRLNLGRLSPLQTKVESNGLQLFSTLCRKFGSQEILIHKGMDTSHCSHARRVYKWEQDGTSHEDVVSSIS